jgi:hypothetical protein
MKLFVSQCQTEAVRDEKKWKELQRRQSKSESLDSTRSQVRCHAQLSAARFTQTSNRKMTYTAAALGTPALLVTKWIPGATTHGGLGLQSSRYRSAKLVPTLTDRGVSRGQRNDSPRPFISVHKTGIRYLFIRQLLNWPRGAHEAEWTPFQTHCHSENLAAPGIEPGTSIKNTYKSMCI